MIFNLHYRVYSNLLLAADLLAGLISLYLAYHFRHLLHRFTPSEWSAHFNPELLPFSEYFFFFALFLPLYIALLLVTQGYRRLLKMPVSRQLLRVLPFVFGAGLCMTFLTYTFKLEISRPVFFLFLGLTFALFALSRVVLHLVLKSRVINEHNQIRMLVVGEGERARRVGEQIRKSRPWGYELVGYAASGVNPHEEGEVVCGLEDLSRRLETDLVVDEIVVADTPARDREVLNQLLRLCEELGIRTRVVADFFPTSISRISLEYLDGLPLVTFSTVPEHNVSVILKRVLDFGVAAVALVFLAPLMLGVAVLIKLTSPGPVFYRQVRCGRYGRRFELIKFRTMEEGAEDRLWEIRHLNEMSGPVFKMKDDPRVTPLGRFLRRYSIDELPQFWNVIKGEMSVVGPRAPLPEEVQAYSNRERRRLSVRPGITCLWQVSGRNEIDFNEWMNLDLKYIDNWSIWLDLAILLRTIPAVFTGRGAR